MRRSFCPCSFSKRLLQLKFPKHPVCSSMAFTEATANHVTSQTYRPVRWDWLDSSLTHDSSNFRLSSTESEHKLNLVWVQQSLCVVCVPNWIKATHCACCFHGYSLFTVARTHSLQHNGSDLYLRLATEPPSDLVQSSPSWGWTWYCNWLHWKRTQKLKYFWFFFFVDNAAPVTVDSPCMAHCTPAAWSYYKLCFTISVCWLPLPPLDSPTPVAICFFCFLVHFSNGSNPTCSCRNVASLPQCVSPSSKKQLTLLFESAITSAARKLKAHLLATSAKGCDASGWRPPPPPPPACSACFLLQQQESPWASAAGCLIWCWMLCDIIRCR